MHTKDKGDLSEAKVLSELKRFEYKVSIPFGDNLPYDMIVDNDGELEKVQVKHGSYNNGCVKFSTRSANSNTNKCWHENYYGKADYFGIYSIETDKCYIVPVDDAGKSSMALRVEEPSTKLDRINWAKNYIIDENSFD